MGIFDSIGRGSIGDIIKQENPSATREKIMKEVRKQYRKEEEDLANEIHPVCGNIVRVYHNVEDTKENLRDSLMNGCLRDVFSSEVKDINKGDHLFVQRSGYTHHGIYIGNGRVIHYLSSGVTEDSLEIFADGAKIHKKSDNESPIRYSRDEVINRAYRRYSEDRYNLIFNNCENFVRWCRSGGEE